MTVWTTAFRDAVVKSLWLAPVLAVVSLTVHARLAEDGYQFLATDPEQQSRILDYRSIVVETGRILHGKPNLQATLKLAHDWRCMIGSGRETHLYPVAADDTSIYGPKGEIVNALIGVSERMLVVARQRRAAGDVNQALSLVSEGLDLSETLKYNDLMSLRFIVEEQRRLVHGFNELAQTPDQKRLAAAALRRFEAKQDDLARMDASMQSAYNLSRSLKGQPPVHFERTEVQASVASTTRNSGPSTVIDSVESDELREIRIAHRSENALKSLIKEQIAILDPSSR